MEEDRGIRESSYRESKLGAVGFVIGIIAIFLVLSLTIPSALILLFYRPLTQEQMQQIAIENGAMFGVVANTITVIILGVIVYFKNKRRINEGREKFVHFRKFDYNDAKAALTITFSSYLFIGIWSIFVGVMAQNFTFWAKILETYESLANVVNAKESAIFLIIYVVILAPLMEEIMMRGLIFERLRISFGLKPAVIVSALIFGIIHLNIFQGVYAVIFGVIFAIIYYYSKSLQLVIFCHFTINALAQIIGRSGSVVLSLGTYVLGIVGLIFFKKAINHFKSKEILENNESVPE